MIAVNTSRNYPANWWDGYSDIGDAVTLAFQLFHPVISSKTLPTPATVYDYSDGAFMTYRGVSFAGILTNFADMPTASLHNITSAFVSARSAGFWATGTGYKVRGNYLLNRKLFDSVNIGRSVVFAFSLWLNLPGTPIFSNASMQVVLKKVNAAWTVTTLITYSPFTEITGRSGSGGAFNDAYTAVLSGTPGTINDGDVVYLDTEITFDVTGTHGLGFAISQNPKNISFISID